MEVDELFTDADLEVSGVWVDAGQYDPTLDGLELKVARMLNPAFSRMFDEKRRTAGAAYDDDEDVQLSIMLECTAKTLLRGWKNLTVQTKPVKFSDDKALEYLSRSTDLRNVVTRIARDRQLYKLEADEDGLKN